MCTWKEFKREPGVCLIIAGGTAIMWAVPLLIASIILWKFLATGPLYELSEGVMNARSAKMSYKGLIWKTHEGWIPVGYDNEGGLEKWKFTAVNKDVAECIKTHEKVRLHYKDYIGMPYKLGRGHQVYKCEVVK